MNYNSYEFNKCDFNDVDIISFNGLKEFIDKRNCLIIDLRSPQEYKKIHVKGAVNIQYNDGDMKIPMVSKDTLIIFYCDSGERALLAAAKMKRLGYNAVAVADRFPH